MSEKLKPATKEQIIIDCSLQVIVESGKLFNWVIPMHRLTAIFDYVVEKTNSKENRANLAEAIKTMQEWGQAKLRFDNICIIKNQLPALEPENEAEKKISRAIKEAIKKAEGHCE